MKTSRLIPFFLLAVAIGCGGPKVETDSNGDTVVTTKAADGSDVKMKASGDPNDPKVTMESKDGKFEGGGTISETDLGIPFFPGSAATEGGNMKSSNAEGSVITCNRTTTESPEKVVDFYKSKLKDPKPSMTTADGSTMASISGKLDSGADVAITIMKGKDEKNTMIAIIVSNKTAKP